MKVAAVGAALLIGMLSMMSAQHVSAGSAEAEKARFLDLFYNAQDGHRVTVQSEGGTTTILEFPQGVLVSLKIPEAGNPPMPDALSLPNTFRGDIEIRARRGDERSPDEGTSARDIMAKAPVVMELQGVVVDVTEVMEQ